MIGVYVGFAMSNYIRDMLECASYPSFLPPRFAKRILLRKTKQVMMLHALVHKYKGDPCVPCPLSQCNQRVI